VVACALYDLTRWANIHAFYLKLNVNRIAYGIAVFKVGKEYAAGSFVHFLWSHALVVVVVAFVVFCWRFSRLAAAKCDCAER
jgi:hypothetical protein